MLVYGLSVVPVARRLGVTGATRSRPLLVGGDPWVVDLGRALGRAGLDVLMWAGEPEQRERIVAAGLALAPGELLATATGEGAELEGVTSVLLLTGEDDFNALAATLLRSEGGPEVYRLAEREEGRGVVAPYLRAEVLFAPGLTGAALAGRHRAGAAIGVGPGRSPLGPGQDLLFTVDDAGRLRPMLNGAGSAPPPGAYAITLGPTGPRPA